MVGGGLPLSTINQTRAEVMSHLWGLQAHDSFPRRTSPHIIAGWPKQFFTPSTKLKARAAGSSSRKLYFRKHSQVTLEYMKNRAGKYLIIYKHVIMNSHQRRLTI